jgi:DNA uptake protein ComE-like DNA-binding protein
MKQRTGRAQRLLKEYLLFSSGERKGVIVLLTLLLILIALPSFYDLLFPQEPVQITVTDLQTMDEHTIDGEKQVQQLFAFDPNTATDDMLGELGFSAKQVKIIRNYLSKGGRFRKAEDLRKIYSIQPAFYQQLEPFIRIAPKQQAGMSDSVRSHKPYVKKVIELNTADSAELVSLYRIGPSLAHRIIEYRSKLGGFVLLDQLKELWGFDEDILYDLEGKIRVDASKAAIYNVNTVKTEELKTHPYFKYKLSNAIVNYRSQHGHYASMNDLKNIVLVNDSVYKRIILYLKLD